MGDFGDGDVALGVEFADVHDHRGELAQEQVAGLAFDVKMVAGVGFAGLALDPIPKALRAVLIEEDEQVFDVLLGDLFLDGGARLRVGDARSGRDFEHDDAGKLRDRCAGEMVDVFALA